MNIKQLCVGVAASMLGVVGCGDSGSSNLYDVLASSESDAIAALCECFELNEFTSTAECISDFDEPASATEIACSREVYETNRAALQPEADCQNEALNDGERCLNAVNACDETAHEACFDSVEVVLEACPEPPQSIQDALEACEEEDPT